jgi:beta-mannosidase
MRRMPLIDGWQLKQRTAATDVTTDAATVDGWLPARVPGSVHEALLAAGRIPDPFHGLNEIDLQWIGETDWLYRCTFVVEPSFVDAGPAALCFDGLDTIATVWLNGRQVLRSDNMFTPQRVPAAPHLRVGSNVITILFESALLYGKAREAEFGKRRAWNGDPSRVYVRKAQYHYGWDWGPCLLTAGPWRAVYLETGAARIAELHCPVEAAADLRSAVFPVRAAIETEHDSTEARGAALMLRVRLSDPDGIQIDQVEIPVPQAGRAEHVFTVDKPALWWPNGQGAQPLYGLHAELVHGPRVLDAQDMKLGVRRVRLVQEPVRDEPGTTFMFEINNRPIFCGGANWIPADSFTTRLSAQDYRLQIAQAAAANMVMLRVWGGGIYEDDVFYALCDEMGLMVWQDFMFACGIYPAHQSFQRSVRAEAEAQVRRLRHHPSVVLWCGNNEDYQVAESIRVYDPDFDGDFSETQFPAREIYERLLPELCAALDPTRPYWPGSPYGGAASSDPTAGDRHTWDIWHGVMAPYSQYPHYEGRFVSEFGMQSSAALATIATCIDPDERYPQSRTMDHHNKSSDGPRRLAAYLNDTLRVRDTLEHYVYATQFVQAEAMAAAYSGWRRRWRGPGKYAVAGALVWQLDDCWPVTSWAIVDYARRPKPAYHVIRRALASIALGLALDGDAAVAWAVNGTARTIAATLEIRTFTLDGLEIATSRREVALEPNRSTELGPHTMDRETPRVLAAVLRIGNEIVARAALWPEPFKYLTLQDPEISIERLGDDRLTLRAKRPAKGIWLIADDRVVWSDNMLDLLPDDPQTITAAGLEDGPVTMQWLQSG